MEEPSGIALTFLLFLATPSWQRANKKGYGTYPFFRFHKVIERQRCWKPLRGRVSIAGMARRKEPVSLRDAVIYCSADTNNANAAQEVLCRAYASASNLVVLRVFCDARCSPVPRAALKTMLEFIEERGQRAAIVIVDDLVRLGSNVAAYKRAQSAIAAVGATIKSATMDSIVDHLPRYARVRKP